MFQFCTADPAERPRSRVSVVNFSEKARVGGSSLGEALKLREDFARRLHPRAIFVPTRPGPDRVNALDQCKERQVCAVRTLRGASAPFSTWFSTFLLKTFPVERGRRCPDSKQNDDNGKNFPPAQ